MSVLRPRAVILDWDNTLVDSWSVIHDALNHTLKAYDKPEWTMVETRQRVRKSMRDSFPGLFGDQWEAAGALFYEHFEAIHVDRLVALPGAGDMIADLSADGIHVAIVSNKTGRLLRLEADHLGWSAHLAHIVGAGDAPADKPAPDPVAMALAGSGIENGPDVWFAGDADVDLECAHNAGCLGVLVRPEEPEDGEFDAFPPAFHVTDCEALSKLILNM